MRLDVNDQSRNDFRATLLRAGIISDDDGGSGLGHDIDRALLNGRGVWACRFSDHQET
jgi:hypothetical protein